MTVDEFLDGMEKIPRDQMNAEISSRSGRSSEYAKVKEIARDVLEPGGEGFRREDVTEDVVNAVRTQIYHLNDDDLSEYEEAKYDVTRSKLKEDGEDKTNDEGEQLYAVYIDQKPKKKEPEGEDDTTQNQENTDQESAVAENGESEKKDIETEAEEDWKEVFDE